MTTSPLPASRSHSDAGRNLASVTSIPPSLVGIWISSRSPSAGSSLRSDLSDSRGNGKKYKYICVEYRFGTFVGVIHRVNGINCSLGQKVSRGYTTRRYWSLVGARTCVWDCGRILLLQPLSESHFIAMNFLSAFFSFVLWDC